ncbi:MAG: hypothetical protein ACE14M_13445 [Terriglobales bacterium]
MMNALRRISGLAIAMVLIAFLTTTLVAQTTTQDPLVQVLVQKGVLTSSDAHTITGTPAEQRDRLAQLLREKGVLSASDLNSVQGSLPAGTFVPVTYTEQAKPAAPAEAKPAAPRVIPAIAPIRVFQLEPSKPGGLIPDVKLGSGARLKFYGYFKLDSAYDSSDPLGVDAPLGAGFGNTALNGAPAYHLYARNTRWGANFEMPDISPKVAVTGKFEMDFQGGFAFTSNAVRQVVPRIRLAYGRVDYRATDKTSLYVVGGQDYTIFGSSTIPNILETTNYWEGGYGSLYQRDPQLRVGLTHNFGGFTMGGDFAIAQAAFGFLPSDLATEISRGEEGSFSQRPDIQARVLFQFQLDHAKGVAPAQIIFSGDQGRYTAYASASDVKSLGSAPSGTSADVERKGWTAEVQLPTRYVTVVAKYFRGNALNWFAGSGLGKTFYTDTTGCIATSAKNATDGSANKVTFCDTGTGIVVAPYRPVRSQGGFAQIGFPLSRIFNADPAGRNAGWQLFGSFGTVQPFAADIAKASQTLNRQYVGVVTLLYKLNQFVTFGIEESYYAGTQLTHVSNYVDGAGVALTEAGGTNPLGLGTAATYRGNLAREWHDFRSQFSTIFTF